MKRRSLRREVRPRIRESVGEQVVEALACRDKGRFVCAQNSLLASRHHIDRILVNVERQQLSDGGGVRGHERGTDERVSAFASAAGPLSALPSSPLPKHHTSISGPKNTGQLNDCNDFQCARFLSDVRV